LLKSPSVGVWKGGGKRKKAMGARTRWESTAVTNQKNSLILVQ